MKTKIIEANIEHKNEILDLYRKAGWYSEADNNPSWLNHFVENSLIFALVKNLSDGKIIGMGRVITDAVSDAYIQDVFVLSEFRGHGIGKEIVNYLSKNLLERGIKWIALVAEPGSQNFYEKLGFKVMPNHTPMKLEI